MVGEADLKVGFVPLGNVDLALSIAKARSSDEGL